MDSSSENAALSISRIGPTSALARALAIRVLFCVKVKDLVRNWMATVVRLWIMIRKLFGGVFGELLWAVNPRNPSVILAAVMGAMFLVRSAKMRPLKAEQNCRRQFWSSLMTSALTYEEWVHAASMLDKAVDRKRDKDLFDEDLVHSKLNDLRVRRLEGGVEDILFFLRIDLVRNLGNMCNPELHKGRLQVPRVIQEYINEVRYQLRAVCEMDSEEFSVDQKIAFIHETRHAFGRTALLLSGGAALGYFHLGVVRTLVEHRLLPRVVAGASVGSITCAFTATRTWSELQSFFGDSMPPIHFFESMGSIIATAHRLLSKGAVHEIGTLQRKMRQLIGDLTFQEAYDLSGRVLGISVCSPRRHEPPRCLNYLTSPNVVIWSAVTASCAFPGLFEAQELMAKDRLRRLVPYHSIPVGGKTGKEEFHKMKRHWRDGSLESDLPMIQLKELFNVNHFIVSQANPHIAPLLRFKELTRAYGGDFAARLAHMVEMEVKHRCSQALELGCRLGGLAKLIAQEWEGDVTIVMPATFAQFAKIIQNPTTSELRKAVMQGRRCTWAKLSAIQANCGIELMLDECVSELDRSRQNQKEKEKFVHIDSRLSRLSFHKRIPSWNTLADESSWGSVDQDGIADQMQAGGPWGGPSLHRLQPRGNSHEGSDCENDGDSMESIYVSWTRVGGPLMRSASANMFVSGHETDRDLTESVQIATTPTDIGDTNDTESGYAATKSSQLPSRDQCCSKRANKIWTSGGCSSRCSDNKFQGHYSEAQYVAYTGQLDIKMSANRAKSKLRKSHSFSGGEVLVSDPIYRTVCECLQPDMCSGNESSADRSQAKGLRTLKSELQVDVSRPTGTKNPEEMVVFGVSSGQEVFRVTVPSPLHGAEAEV